MFHSIFLMSILEKKRQILISLCQCKFIWFSQPSALLFFQTSIKHFFKCFPCSELPFPMNHGIFPMLLKTSSTTTTVKTGLGKNHQWMLNLGEILMRNKILCHPRLSTIYKGIKTSHFKVERRNNILNVDENSWHRWGGRWILRS